MKRKILVVDDEHMVRRVLARALSQAPYELISACDGDQALAAAAAESPDVILLDVDMPEKSGWDVLKELRRNTMTRTIPVIMVTGCDAPQDLIGGLRLGADDYVTKPFNIEELRARVDGVLRRSDIDLSANPLTRLPGNPAIEQEVNRLLEERVPFAFLYADINHFKPYNDVYGFERGDAVIRETARLLVQSARSGAERGFVGHIGGDDFVLITGSADAPSTAQRVATAFDERAPSFYEPGDRRRGALHARDRQGRWQDFPLLSLSIGVAVSQGSGLNEYAKIVRVASEMKNFCKAQAGSRLSRFAFDRRQHNRFEGGKVQ